MLSPVIHCKGGSWGPQTHPALNTHEYSSRMKPTSSFDIRTIGTWLPPASLGLFSHGPLLPPHAQLYPPVSLATVCPCQCPAQLHPFRKPFWRLCSTGIQKSLLRVLSPLSLYHSPEPSQFCCAHVSSWKSGTWSHLRLYARVANQIASNRTGPGIL